MPLSISHSKRYFAKGICVLFISACSFMAASGELVHRPADNLQWPENLVRAVQMKLNELGYDAGTADGIIGPNTQRAVRALQQEQELEVTGEINAELLQVLGLQQ